MSEPTLLQARGVEIRYGALVAVSEVTFQLESGSFLAVVGPNGSGKSSLVRAILGLVPLTQGKIDVLGKPAGHGPAERIGYVPQFKTFDRHYPALAIEVVATGLHRSWAWRLTVEDRALCMAALERVDVGAIAERPVGELSGGQLQRVYLARALIRKPSLILLDEPATGVDYVGQADFYALLHDVQKELGTTLVMVTHDLEVASHHASEVLLLNRKQIAFGTPTSVLSQSMLGEAFGHIGHDHDTHPDGEHHTE